MEMGDEEREARDVLSEPALQRSKADADLRILSFKHANQQ